MLNHFESFCFRLKFQDYVEDGYYGQEELIPSLMNCIGLIGINFIEQLIDCAFNISFEGLDA